MAIYDNSDIIARSRANETASMLTTADSLGGTREFNWENNVRKTYTTTSTLAIALPTLGSRREVRIHTSTAAYIKFGNSAVGAATVGQGNMKSPPEAPDVIKIPAGHTHFRVIGETAGGNISITAAACGMGIGQLGLMPASGNPMSKSYYQWRIYVTAVDGSLSYATFSDVGFFASDDGTGTNLATTRIAQSQSGDGAIGPASAIFNGNVVDEGGSSQPLPYWVSAQWAEPVSVGSVALSAQRVLPDRTAKDFIVQGSDDGVTWFDVYSKSGETGWVQYETRVYSLSL